MLKATIIGNLGSDPDLRYSASGSPFMRFNVASSYRTRTPEGEWQERTEWVRCTVFGQRAESLGQYLKKGMRVYVEGWLEARPWTDQQGQVRAGLEVTAQDVEFTSSRQGDDDAQSIRASVADERRDRQPVEAGTAGADSPPSEPMDDSALEDLPF